VFAPIASSIVLTLAVFRLLTIRARVELASGRAADLIRGVHLYILSYQLAVVKTPLRLSRDGPPTRESPSSTAATPDDGDGSLLQPDPPKGVAHDPRTSAVRASRTPPPYACALCFQPVASNPTLVQMFDEHLAAATHIVHCALGALAETASCAPPHSRRTHAARIVARCPDINAQTTETDSPNMQAADPPQPHGGQLAVVGPGMLARTPSLPQPGPQRAPLDVFII
jgi:hypothetical protein